MSLGAPLDWSFQRLPSTFDGVQKEACQTNRLATEDKDQWKASGMPPAEVRKSVSRGATPFTQRPSVAAGDRRVSRHLSRKEGTPAKPAQ